MTRRDIVTVAGAVAMIAAAALFLGTWKDRQRLGTPGVRVKAGPFPSLRPGATNAGDLLMVGTNHVDLPEVVPGFGSLLMPLDPTVPGGLPADTVYGQRLYTNSAGATIQNMVVLMGTDRTSIHQPQYCLRGAGWVIASTELTSVSIPYPDPYDLPVAKLTVRRKIKDASGQVREHAGVFLYWFVADGQLTNDHKERMWLLARDLVTRGVLQRWAYVIAFQPCRVGQEDEAYAQLKRFLEASVPLYQTTGGPPA